MISSDSYIHNVALLFAGCVGTRISASLEQAGTASLHMKELGMFVLALGTSVSESEALMQALVESWCFQA